ncbi:MAG: hypothetical protein EOR68_13220 [Mesorhizobium sp.]|uniref:hypothetical protein n=1 Tax=Mesorhizobium sp. TaxID=1871066 RepID=UPI000FE67243|nr:hypothetical protein [Mesorhizobium sp.]RWL99599.1 MAG: hypothetical protein EOR68_13220 [Mesorhizobium sp.]TIP49402.1 MAG: hypothetical protein E5X77_11045 [Mesorhizobium sp.]
MPKAYFDDVWARADLFGALHAYVSNNAAPALDPSELLRAEWAMRVSALDLYVHEVVAQNLLAIFQGKRPTTLGFAKLQISSDALLTIRSNGTGLASDNAFDLSVRTRLERVTYQYPDDIADGIRLVSNVELWNDIAKHFGATGAAVRPHAKTLKDDLRRIVERRNKIVHAGDLQPGVPRTAWPIARADVDHVKIVIGRIVDGIQAVV